MSTSEIKKFFRHAHGGNITRAQMKYGLKREEILDFSANINPLGLSKKVKKAVLDSIESVVDYPDPDCSVLRGKLSKYLKVEYENIIIGNGAAEIIYLVAKQLNFRKAGRKYKVLIPAPTFAEYASAAAGNGGDVKLFALSPGNDFTINFDELAAGASDCDAVFLCNPNNPTGNLIKKDILTEFIRQVTGFGSFIVIDEAFMDFVEDREMYSLMREAESIDNLIVLGSLTKFFALPGLRLGYAVSTRKNIQDLIQAKDPWSVNGIAQAAGSAALDDAGYIEESLSVISSQKKKLAEGLKRIPGLKVFTPSVNFILVNCQNTGIQVRKIVNELGRQGILIRDCSNYPLLDDFYFRVAVRTESENKMLVERLRDVIERLSRQT